MYTRLNISQNALSRSPLCSAKGERVELFLLLPIALVTRPPPTNLSAHPPTSAPAQRPKRLTSTVRIAAAAATAAPAIAVAAATPSTLQRILQGRAQTANAMIVLAPRQLPTRRRAHASVVAKRDYLDARVPQKVCVVSSGAVAQIPRASEKCLADAPRLGGGPSV